MGLFGNFVVGYQGYFQPNYPVVVANGQQVSSTIVCQGLVLCGVLLPATLTSTTLSFLASVDNINFFPVKSGTTGTLLSYTVAQATYAAMDPKDFHGINYLQLKTGSAEGGARTLIASLKGF